MFLAALATTALIASPSPVNAPSADKASFGGEAVVSLPVSDAELATISGGRSNARPWRGSLAASDIRAQSDFDEIGPLSRMQMNDWWDSVGSQVIVSRPFP